MGLNILDFTRTYTTKGTAVGVMPALHAASTAAPGPEEGLT